MMLLITFMNELYFICAKFLPDYEVKKSVKQITVNNSYSKAFLMKQRLAITLLKEYKELLDSGVITQEEFDEKKAQMLK